MARIRSIKPELRDSRVVASWPVELRYFFVLLWGYLDDYGRGHDMPKKIAGDCFPHDTDAWTSDDIDKWLTRMGDEFEGRPGPVCRYTVAGTRYIHAVNWGEHQRPNRPTPSRLPPCPQHEALREWLTEPLTESLDGASLTGAAEQQRRGAGEQQQAAREPAHETQPTSGEIRIVADATDATPDEAADVIALATAGRKVTNRGGFLRRLAADGDLQRHLADLRVQRVRADTATRLATIRAGPDCPHRVPGGTHPHPQTGQPVCPLCRTAGVDPAATA